MVYDLQFLVVILTLFYGTSVCSEEIEGKTLPYLTTRPLTKSGIVIGKFAAYTALSALMVFVSLAASYLIMNGSTGWATRPHGRPSCAMPGSFCSG